LLSVLLIQSARIVSQQGQQQIQTMLYFQKSPFVSKQMLEQQEEQAAEQEIRIFEPLVVLAAAEEYEQAWLASH